LVRRRAGAAAIRSAADGAAEGGGTVKYLRWPLRLYCIIALALAGATACGNGINSGTARPLYGMGPPEHDPSVVLQDFSYTPASPIHVGDALTFTLRLNHPLVRTDAAWLNVELGNPSLAGLKLKDEGLAPDSVAGDGIYSGSFYWTLSSTDEIIPTAKLHWRDGAPVQQLSGPPLMVLPKEQGE
jgi:hypothetical protein